MFQRGCRPLLLACLLLPVLAFEARGQNPLAPRAESPVYDDLDHFRALGYWRGSLEIRPISAARLARAVEEIESRARTRPLAGGEAVRLARLRSELAALGEGAAVGAGLPGDAPAPAGKEEAAGIPRVDWRLGFALRGVGTVTSLDTLPDLERRPRRDWAFAFTQDIRIGRRFAVQTRFYEDYSRLSPAPVHRWVDNGPDSLGGVFADPSARNDRAVAALAWNWGDLRFGREDRRLGVGRHGTLFLGENVFPLDGFSLGLRTRWVSLGSVLGQTSRRPTPGPADTTATGEPLDTRADAYLAAHRVELHPPALPARVGFFEAVVWSERGLDLGYANPLAILTAVTQDVFDLNGADDKKVVGGDLSLDLAPVSLYGEILLNRLVTGRTATEGRHSEISSLAELAGLRWACPAGLSGADFTVEYAHLDPEVYFHKDRDRNRALYAAGEPIGHWLGPNADDLFAALDLPPDPRWGSVRLAFSRSRWGLVDGMRGRELGFASVRKDQKDWITGKVQTEKITSVRWLRGGWRVPVPGRVDTQLTFAWVDRTGATARGGKPWADSSADLELRLTWRWEHLWTQAAGPGEP